MQCGKATSGFPTFQDSQERLPQRVQRMSQEAGQGWQKKVLPSQSGTLQAVPGRVPGAKKAGKIS